MSNNLKRDANSIQQFLNGPQSEVNEKQPQQILGSKVKAPSACITDLIKIYLHPPFVGKELTHMLKKGEDSCF